MEKNEARWAANIVFHVNEGLCDQQRCSCLTVVLSKKRKPACTWMKNWMFLGNMLNQALSLEIGSEI